MSTSESPPPRLPPTALSRIPFTLQDEKNLQSLVVWMKIAAVINFLSGAANAIQTFYPNLDLGKAISAVVNILIGLWVWQAAAAFQSVATTDRADQRFLVEGFGFLRRAFLLQSILVIIMLAFVCAALLIALVAAFMMGTKPLP